MSNISFDFVIVGAGIVGLTVAYELIHRQPNSKIIILEKEAGPGVHASGRNSGVMHSGIYYGSDTLKAQVCAEGRRQMIKFAKAENINYSECGKVILATSEDQLPTVDQLLQNARNNNIPAERIDTQQLHELEPYAADGPAAIYCPSTAVIDSVGVVNRLKEILEKKGVKFLFDAKVLRVNNKNQGGIETKQGNIKYGYLFNCAGAYADVLAKKFGLAKDYALVPFKGIYWKLNESANSKVRANIYPVPDISLPFLGVHLTRVITGDVYVGPTAIPALGRENYSGIKGVNFSEATKIGIQLASMYFQNNNNFRKLAHMEMGKYYKGNFLSAARKLMPSLIENDMVFSPKSGIRPQLINVHTRKLEMDYIFEKTDNSLHILNTISPAFTSSFAFSKKILDESGLN